MKTRIPVLSTKAVFVWLQGILLHSDGEVCKTGHLGGREEPGWPRRQHRHGNLPSVVVALQPEQPDRGTSFVIKSLFFVFVSDNSRYVCRHVWRVCMFYDTKMYWFPPAAFKFTFLVHKCSFYVGSGW